jgi:hypothetical protein
MKFSKFLALVVFSSFVAGCASSAPKKDPFAEAAAAKRIEIDRLSKTIDSLRVLPTSEETDRKLDSLRALRSLEAGNLLGIGHAAKDKPPEDGTGTFLYESGKHTIERIENESRKYPSQKP